VSFVVSGVALVAVCHCSNEDTLLLPARTDGGVADANGGARDGPCATPICVTTGNCNNVVNDGPNVTPQFVTGTAPAPVGGAIGDGKWTLTAYTVYTGDGGIIPTPEWARAAVVITGDQFDIVSAYRSEGFTQKDSYETYTFTTLDLTLTLTGECPGSVSGTRGSTPYSASATEFEMYTVAFVGITVEEVFTKQ
jgi:hypothetical protein